MLVLFETPAGFALFQLHKEGKLKKPDSLYKTFSDLEKAKKILSLKDFLKFEDTADALVSTTALLEGKMSKPLKKFLKKTVVDQGISEQLAVCDAALGKSIKKKLGIDCVADSNIMELFRCIRFQLNDLISEDLASDVLQAMSLGLAHSLGRYKLKFSPDKVDVMIVQAISLLDDLDKEINTYAMRVKEWYGWHFPELARILSDNMSYVRFVKLVGHRSNIHAVDISEVVEESIVENVIRGATISMGSDISAEDVTYVQHLCVQVLDSQSYREQLSAYIFNRMKAIAPNLTVLVGELVGARLIAHAGSLMNLAKHPASTVQIIGAEKALFRAIKSKRNTPKYGIIYHASLVGQTSPKNKGKISRVLANKAALSIRVDALGDENTRQIGVENLQKVQERMFQLEGHTSFPKSGTAPQKYEHPENTEVYNEVADDTIAQSDAMVVDSNGDGEMTKKEKRKSKKEKRKSKKSKKRKRSEGEKDSKKKSKTDN